MQSTSHNWLRARHSGVLAHVSSLPGPHGIGDFGRGARRLIDFLADYGFRFWQICPLGPTGYGDSPYQSFSSFAGNAYFIDLEELVGAGLLLDEDCRPLRLLSHARTNYGALYREFWPILATAYERFLRRGAEIPGWPSYREFCAREAPWLDSYAEFMAIKAGFESRSWTTWPEPYRTYRPGLHASLPAAAQEVAGLHRFAQFVFFTQWRHLRAYAASRGVEIIGDIPIFVALDSADAWSCRSILRFDAHGHPLAVAGVPPDYFSASGQLWGNPLYDWTALEKTGYAWWIERLRAALALYDVVRLDHFRGFDTYWEIPGDAEDARRGRWRNGPGLDFFEHVQAALPEARLIAEDLGYITAEVFALRRAAHLPGMRILQFGYGHDDNNVNLPHFLPDDSVVYTGTHDNNTTRGWLDDLPADMADRVDAYYQLGGESSALPLVRAALASVARLAIVPMQDLLDLDGSARMNHPGTAEGNWQWRFTSGQLEDLADEHGETFRAWNALFDRTSDPRQRDYSAPPSELPSHAGHA